MKSERWKPIVGYGGWYEVSDLGRVKRVRGGGHGTYPGRIQRPVESSYGYIMARLHVASKGRTLRLHRLVMAAFRGPCPAGKEVNHINGIKTDNRPVAWICDRIDRVLACKEAMAS